MKAKQKKKPGAPANNWRAAHREKYIRLAKAARELNVQAIWISKDDYMRLNVAWGGDGMVSDLGFEPVISIDGVRFMWGDGVAGRRPLDLAYQLFTSLWLSQHEDGK